MKNRLLVFSTLMICLLAFAHMSMGADTGKVVCDKFLADLAAQAADAEKKSQSVIQGKDGILFFVPELRSLSAGQFWGTNAAKVSRVSNIEYADPLPAILDFKSQLDKAGIDLLIVPVPAKSTIYPEAISSVNVSAANRTIMRTDLYQQEFYTLLRSKGVKVLDLVPSFIKNRSGNAGPLYCRQDTHWSGQACVIAGGLIGAEINKYPWAKSIKKKKYESEKKTVSIKGDLLEALGDASIKSESLTLTFIKEKTAAGMVPVSEWRQSPVLLLGDSHNLIFHSGGDMQAQGAGLADHLAVNLGFPVDVVAVRGSGATPSRINLLRRNDNLKGKRLVVWCFSIREFTEGQGWRKVPLIK
ncbi:MAG: alginate O-acetyltransferase AlgX-related protein [Armatimonadota bacterium]